MRTPTSTPKASPAATLPFALLLSCVLALALCVAPLPTAAGATYVVDPRHPAAADAAADGGGAADKPFRTIGAAAKVAKAGDTVVIGGGVYRESVAVSADGSAEAPITFRAADGERVVVTGADQITRWEAVPPAPNGPIAPDGHAGPGGERIFRTPWPHRFIANSKTFTHPDDDFHHLVGRAEQVFVGGYAMQQVLDRQKLARGTFYVDLDAKQLYVQSRDNRDLSKDDSAVEASVRPVIWTVSGAHVRLKGLRFRYAANAAQQGAVQIRGQGATIEDCVFEQTNSIGCSFGGSAEVTGIVVRRCVFQDNGQMGFSAVRAHGLLMTGCTIRHNSTKGWDRGWEAGGDKICLARGLVVEACEFLDNAGTGVWFDIGNEDCQVRNCHIAGNDDSGIFYEISFGLKVRDNVIVANGLGGGKGSWGANGGISLSSSPGCVVERNLVVGNCEGFQFREQTRTTPRIAAGEKEQAVWNHDQTIRNNYFAANRDWQVGGWFDVLDGRHWPKAMQSGQEKSGSRPAADVAAGYQAKGPGLDTSLEQLHILLDRNLYFARPGQGLLLWGCTWRKHRKYADLEAVRKELGLEAAGVTAEPAFADPAAGDFRLPADHPAIRLGCYPQGPTPVPGVRLGVIPK
jgi:hypothetical protein